MDPNGLAYAMLLAWPLVSIILFRALGPFRGLLACILGGYLVLPPAPAGFDLPILPTLDKESIPSFSALLIYFAAYRSDHSILPKSTATRVLLAMLLASPVLTNWTNRDPVFWGSFVTPAMRLQDSVSSMLGLVAVVTPFLLAQAFINTEERFRGLLWAIVLGTFLYSFPMLLEVRLSPQLNTWIYGYFQHDFLQMMRGGGFRPIVFLPHGLWVALLTAWAVLAAVTLLRSGAGGTLTAALGAIWLMGVLILCKSMGSLLYALAGVPLVLLAPKSLLVRASALVAVLFLAYPLMRQADVIPTQRIVGVAESFSQDRASSLQFRFDHEKVLLDRALMRPAFGWGGWGRNLVYEENTGRQLTVPDGFWIGLLGASGWFGFIAHAGLLTLPILSIWWRGTPTPPMVVAGGMIILATNLVDLVPNGTITSLTWLFSGALLGWIEGRVPSEAPVRASTLSVVLGAKSGQDIRTIL